MKMIQSLLKDPLLLLNAQELAYQLISSSAPLAAPSFRSVFGSSICLVPTYPSLRLNSLRPYLQSFTAVGRACLKAGLS